MSLAKQDFQRFPRVAVVNHDLERRSGPAVCAKLLNDTLGMRSVMNDAEGKDQIVRLDGQKPT